MLVSPSTSAEPLPTIPISLETELVAYAKTSKKPGHAIVRIVSSGGRPAVERDLTPLRGKEVENGSARDRKIRENLAALQADLATIQASSPGLDVIGPLDVASQYPGSRIVFLGSGLSTAAPVDMTQLGWNFDPSAVAESVHRQGLFDLTSKDVTFYGLGVTGGAVQPRLPAYARKLLEELWIAVCQKAGAAGCTIGKGEPSTAAPKATLSVPMVPVPAAYTDASGCPVWQRLDDAVLFEADSAALTQRADDALRPVVLSAERCAVSEGSVAVVGHIAATLSDPSDSSNLSGRRARAVADRLLHLGLPPKLLGAIEGRGSSEPVLPNLAADGQFIESAARQNRRVEIFLNR
ncbi:OmpA family protein [Nocardia aurea]|uniref:OmpA family protein n=1 Tax=Nocardia aurea TaxID=2144174 RepID=A0ABV3FYA0_9NOCA